MRLRYGTAEDQRRDDLEEDLRAAINRNSDEGRSNTPDHVLARFLMDCLDAFHAGVHSRERAKSKATEDILTREAEADEARIQPAP